jgi:hypothetical protein
MGAKRAIRALIGARKNWGGNRTPRGARAQAVLTSILQTAKQQDTKPFDVLLELLGSSDPHKILDLVPARQTPLEPTPRSIPHLGSRFPSSLRHRLRQVSPPHPLEFN